MKNLVTHSFFSRALTWIVVSAVLSVMSASPLRAQYSLLDTSKPYVGISQRDVNDEDARDAGLENAEGVVVLLVAPKTPLFNSGVREGDILLRIGDAKLNSSADLKALLSGKLKLGETMPIEVWREGESLSLELELTAMSIPERLEGIEYLAEKGNHEAGMFLYRTFYNGLEKVSVDKPRAMKWLRHAAEDGSPMAQAILAVHFRSGVDVKRDLTEALSWYRKSADGGLASGYVGIGSIYYDSLKGDERNPEKAAAAFKQAAEQDDPWGWFHLGRMYWNGDYLKRNDEKGVGCFKKSIELSDLADGHIYMAMAYENGRGVVRNYPEALRHYRKAAEKGNPQGLFAVGVFYYQGYAVNKDLKEAADWFERAANRGHGVAQNNLGLMYLNGDGVAKDLKKAKTLFDGAAAKGVRLANTNLGMMYESGIGVEKDLKAAAENFVVAAKDGDPSAQASLAAMVLDGRYYKRDDAAALQWIQKAVAKNHARAERLMGHMYEYGRAVPKDRAEAIAWYLKAADHGDKWSAEHLKELQQ